MILSSIISNKHLFLLFGLLIFPISILATTINIPSQYNSIQEGIDAAVDGDTIIVEPGTYTENINYNGKAILLISSGGAESTFIQPAIETLPIVTITNHLDTFLALDGFTIQNATKASGIYSDYASPIIQNCRICECYKHTAKYDYGAGIHLERSGALIRHNKIYNNSVSFWGGGIYVRSNWSVEISYNEIYDNEAGEGGGIAAYGGNTAVNIHHNIFYGNSADSNGAGGIYIYNMAILIVNNTIVNNYNGVKFETSIYGHFYNNIVAGNTGYGFFAHGWGTCPVYCDFWGNESGDDQYVWHGMNEDPIFNDPENHDYSLKPFSPCIDAGHPDPEYYDPDGTRNDLGAIPYNYQLPVAVNMNFGGEDPKRLISHNPTFFWSYHDTMSISQQGYEIEISSLCDELDSFVADMWSSGLISTGDTSATYEGGELLDGITYCLRIRLSGDGNPGGWKYTFFMMNIAPSAPRPVSPVEDDMAYVDGAQLVVDTVYNPDNDTIIYDFELYDSYPGEPIDISYNRGTNCSKLFSGLLPDQIYQWRARVYDGYEHSEWSEVVPFQTRAGNVIIHVPDGQPTIQDAIIRASLYDTIMVADGIYRGDGNRDIIFMGKTLVVTSSDGITGVTIDCEGSSDEPHRAFSMPLLAEKNIQIKGFTVQNGYADTGGAIYCYYSATTLKNCRFINNHAEYGGAIGGAPAGFTIENCLFQGNSADADAGAIDYLRNSTVIGSAFRYNLALGNGGAIVPYCGNTVTNCEFYGNEGGLGVVYLPGSGDSGDNNFLRCLFVRNEEYVVVGSECHGTTFDQCTFYGNEKCLYMASEGYFRLKNSIIAFNGSYAALCYCMTFDEYTFCGAITLEHCDVYGNAADYTGCIEKYADSNGNIWANPMFCDPAQLDFRLKDGSPCIGAGTDGINMGAYPAGCKTGDPDDPDDPDNPDDPENPEPLLPNEYSMNQNFPNPFNGETMIEFALPKDSHVKVRIYNLLGRLVAEPVDADYSAGWYQISWNGKDSHNKAVSSGMYFYTINAGDFTATRKMLLLK